MFRPEDKDTNKRAKKTSKTNKILMASAKTILIEHKIPENTPRRGFFAFCKLLQTAKVN